MTGGSARKSRQAETGQTRNGDAETGQAGAHTQEGSRHVPVLLAEVLDHLKPQNDETYVDGTFGAGGYTRALLDHANCAVIAIDRDPGAIADGLDMVLDYAPRLTLIEGRFGDMERVLNAAGAGEVDGIVLDIGVSSMHLDEADRGFSFMRDGPLDMRMGGSGPTAADVLAQAEESDIADILYYLGEERRSRAIARAIVKRREELPLTRTLELAELVGRVLGHRKSDPKHPATRTFQALRIYVNDELGELAEGLVAAEKLLKPGGRLVVVTFHSLEDRIVKRFFASRCGKVDQGSRHQPVKNVPQINPSFQFVNRRPVSPDERETDGNPRARSAKLRAVRRTDAASWDGDTSDELKIPRLKN